MIIFDQFHTLAADDRIRIEIVHNIDHFKIFYHLNKEQQTQTSLIKANSAIRTKNTGKHYQLPHRNPFQKKITLISIYFNSIELTGNHLRIKMYDI